jgi:hypothetical protein
MLDEIEGNCMNHKSLCTAWCAEKVAFYARANIADGVTSAMNFNLAPVNTGNGYCISLKSFTCPVSGLYWLFLTVVCSGQPADVTVVGNQSVSTSGHTATACDISQH